MRREKAKNIKLLITDVDGVMTDGGMYFSSTGEEMKRFSARDGMSVGLCRQNGIEYGIISAGHSLPLVAARAKVLKVDLVYVGYTPKTEILKEWLQKLQLKAEEVAYIGDDLKDIEIMQMVGLSACPADAAKQVQAIADVVLTKNGGHGCIREFTE
ncbi:MAG: HAD-IIIA family hydrolase, partial [Schleiferiaceae bacterium]|nr:HAD-IIIA family hydrolase [Schleiferiaceae bacterium]